MYHAFLSFFHNQIQLKLIAEEMQAVSKGLEKVEQELTASENDGAISVTFRMVINKLLNLLDNDEVFADDFFA